MSPRGRRARRGHGRSPRVPVSCWSAFALLEVSTPRGASGPDSAPRPHTSVLAWERPGCDVQRGEADGELPALPRRVCHRGCCAVRARLMALMVCGCELTLIATGVRR